ncbi:MAG: hypothetical protein LUC18_02925 [Porphyromonadaceae bacterium]|nr:hypothetical protein [Porphyromonadaceae bacterium]
MDNKGTLEMHPAEAYLRNVGNPNLLCVRIDGKRRRLFINRDDNAIGILAPGKRKKGYRFSRWEAIEKIYYPAPIERTDAERNRRGLLKYRELARHATHTNDWLRRIATADPGKSLYENHITSGTAIDGKCIRLSTIGKYCGSTALELFRKAMIGREKFSTGRFDFCGYDGTLWCEPGENGDMMAGFNKEYRNCVNGYYYMLINNDNVIGYDVD